MYLMCGPSQPFFSLCGPEMPQGQTPLVVSGSGEMGAALRASHPLHAEERSSETGAGPCIWGRVGLGTCRVPSGSSGRTEPLLPIEVPQKAATSEQRLPLPLGSLLHWANGASQHRGCKAACQPWAPRGESVFQDAPRASSEGRPQSCKSWSLDKKKLGRLWPTGLGTISPR